MWSSNKAFKDFKIFWTVHSGTKVRIWICSEYYAVFNFSCIASCNLAKSFTLFFISSLSWESDSESFKQSGCTLYASEILLFKVFINSCQLTGEMPIDWSYFLCAWHSVNPLSVSVTDSNLSWSYSESVANKNLALYWQQNSCPGTTLIFFGFSSLNHLDSDHLFTFNFATMFHQYCTAFTFPPLKNIPKHLFIM